MNLLQLNTSQTIECVILIEVSIFIVYEIENNLTQPIPHKKDELKLIIDICNVCKCTNIGNNNNIKRSALSYLYLYLAPETTPSTNSKTNLE